MLLMHSREEHSSQGLKIQQHLTFPVSSSRLESGTQNGVLNADGCQNGSQSTLNPQPTPILDQGTV